MTLSPTNQNLVRPESDTELVNITGIVRLISSASDALFAQAKLHRQLAEIELKEEKERLSHMFTAFFIGFSCFTCLLISLGFLAISLAWSTGYQTLSIVTLSILYGLATYFAWKQLIKEARRPGRFFTATREEIAADLAMIKSKLK